MLPCDCPGAAPGWVLLESPFPFPFLCFPLMPQFSFLGTVWASPLSSLILLLPFSLDSQAARACLNEHHLFFLLAGAFMGYSYSLLYFVNNMNYLPFPIIQVRRSSASSHGPSLLAPFLPWWPQPQGECCSSSGQRLACFSSPSSPWERGFLCLQGFCPGAEAFLGMLKMKEGLLG